MKQLILFAFCVSLISYANSQDRDVYFLSVGISESMNPNFKAIGANSSAIEMAKLFQKNGAKYCISLISRNGEIVTKNDIYRNINMLLYAAEKSKSNPFIIYYFCGHGISEKFGFNHFSIPGDFNETPGNIIKNDFTNELVYTADIYDTLKESCYDFIMLLDNCYSSDSSQVISNYQNRVSRLYCDASEIVKVMNQFHGPNPVIFSAIPGTLVKSVEHPYKKYTHSIGPLARRTIIATRNSTFLNLSDLVKYLIEGQDPKTNPCITFWEPKYDFTIINGDKPKGILVQNKGTNISDDDEIEKLNTKFSFTTELNKGSKGFFEISFSGPEHEWISDGVKHFYSSKQKTVTIDQYYQNEIVFHYDDFGDDDWDFEFSAPKRFEVKTYQEAQRNGFQDIEKPGISITGDGRGCNELSGAYTVKKIHYDNSGRIIELEIDFIQYCDGDKKPINGSLKFNID